MFYLYTLLNDDVVRCFRTLSDDDQLLQLARRNGQICVTCRSPPRGYMSKTEEDRPIVKIEPQLLSNTIQAQKSAPLILLPHFDPPRRFPMEIFWFKIKMRSNVVCSTLASDQQLLSTERDGHNNHRPLCRQHPWSDAKVNRRRASFLSQQRCSCLSKEHLQRDIAFQCFVCVELTTEPTSACVECTGL